MSRSLSNLRRVLFGVSCAVVFGFGGMQALAAPAQPMRDGCTAALNAECDRRCKLEGEQNTGYCVGYPPYWSCECFAS